MQPSIHIKENDVPTKYFEFKVGDPRAWRAASLPPEEIELLGNVSLLKYSMIAVVDKDGKPIKPISVWVEKEGVKMSGEPYREKVEYVLVNQRTAALTGNNDVYVTVRGNPGGPSGYETQLRQLPDDIRPIFKGESFAGQPYQWISGDEVLNLLLSSDARVDHMLQEIVERGQTR